MKLTATLLRSIIAEEVRRVVSESDEAAEIAALEDSAADWVDDNYDAILAKMQADPKLTAAVLKAAGVNESYAGDLARGVGNFYSTWANEHPAVRNMATVGGAVGGYAAAEIMAMVNDPSLIPWTQLRELQLDDKVIMDGSAFKAMAVGVLVGHLVDVARHAKAFADKESVRKKKSSPVR